MRPNDRKYLKSHEWCLIADGVATLGITDHAVAHLSDLVYLDLPEVGSQVKSGEAFGRCEHVRRGLGPRYGRRWRRRCGTLIGTQRRRVVACLNLGDIV
jgi:hypothetical protein